jgi:hypothetical protein
VHRDLGPARSKGSIVARYKFRFEQDGDLVYEGDQSAIWSRVSTAGEARAGSCFGGGSSLIAEADRDHDAPATSIVTPTVRVRAGQPALANRRRSHA